MLKRRILKYQYTPLSYPHVIETYTQHHAALIECCKKKDAITADKTMKIHVRKVKEVVMQEAIESSLSARQNFLV